MRSCILAVLLAALPVTATLAAERSAEVMHSWVSGSERGALSVIQTEFTRRGGSWIDNPQKNELEMRQVLMERLTNGTAPNALQWHGSFELHDMATSGLVADIDDVATKGKWDAILPAAVKRLIKDDGHYYLAPTGIHSENWIFYNMHVLADHGIAAPRTMADFLAAVKTLQTAGVTPIAMGASDWESRVMWSSILLGALGPDNFRKLFDDKDASVLDHPEALDAFRLFKQLIDYTGSEATRPKDWAAASANLAKGQAAFQFQGEWVKGELQKQGLVVGRDFGCIHVPGSENAIALVIDAFAFPRTVGINDTATRDLLASTIMDPEVQIGFNAIKGSVPARLDTPPARLDVCARLSLDLLAHPNAAATPPGQAMNADEFADIEILLHQLRHDPALQPEAALATLKTLIKQMRRS